MMKNNAVLPVETLHLHHYGITPAIAANYAEAAAMCLSRHHTPPIQTTVISHDERKAEYYTTWQAPSRRQRAGWNNRIDTTETGAYCVALAAVEAHLGLVAVARAEDGSGADYIVAPLARLRNPTDGLIDMELALRLEVSGIGECSSESMFANRIAEKVEQLLSGDSELEGIAGVVAFNYRRVVFQRAVRCQ